MVNIQVLVAGCHALKEGESILRKANHLVCIHVYEHVYI